MAISKKDFYTGVALAVVTTIIWSGNYVVARGIYKQLPPVSLATYRWALATICIAPFAWKKFVREKEAFFKHRQYIFWTALTGITFFNTLIYIAGHYTSAINLALIGTTSTPIFATLLAVLFIGEKASPLRIAGLLTCVLGLLYLLCHGNFRQLSQLHFGKGDLVVLISAFSFAIYNTLVRKKPAAISPMSFLFVVFAVGTLCLMPFYGYELAHTQAVHWTPSMIGIIFYLGIGNSVVAYFCWNASIARLGASGTALFANLIPVFSTIEAVMFLDEEFTTIHLISGALIICGLVIANLRKPS